MREEIRNFLKIHKADIVESLTAGAVDQLLVDLSVHLNDGDRQRIECDATQKGHSWAADTLVDCLKCYDTATFTKFLQNIKKNPATKELYRELEESCVDKGLSSLLPTGNTKPQNKKNAKQDAKALLQEMNPNIIQNFTEGDLYHMLMHFEEDLTEEDVQKIKCDLKRNGKNKAVSLTINCLRCNGRGTFKKFIKYLFENKKDLFKDFKVKCCEYGLENLLPPSEKEKLAVQETVPEKVDCPSAHKAVCNISENLPVPESSESSKPATKENFEDANMSITKEVHILTEPAMSSGTGKNTIEIYKMSSEPRGVCLIINNEEFGESRKAGKTKWNDRKGSSVDEENLYQLFIWLKFDVMRHRNLTAMEMWNIFLNLSKEDHSKYDCLAVCILSHGESVNNKDHIVGVDGKSFEVYAMIELFNGRTCKSLVGKPKLYFLQCCRGLKEDLGAVAKGEYQHDGNDAHSDEDVRYPDASDCFVGYSTPPGYKSWRNTVEGSWYISTICRVFQDMARDFDLMTMMTKVNDAVSDYSTDENRYQIPNPSMTLRKLLYFNPK